MARLKLRLVGFHGEESFIHLEPSEEARAMLMLDVLPKFPQWTPISRLAKEIGHSTLMTTTTAIRLWAASRAEKDDGNGGKPLIVAKAPIILLRKEKYNPRNNKHKTKFLCPTIFFKNP